MKNQIRSLQSVLFLLLAILGFNAFTTPRDTIQYDISEGKIQAGIENYKTSLVAQYQQAQQDYKKMNIDFDVKANQSESNMELQSDMSLLAQSLYVYDKELKSLNFFTLSLEQRQEFLSRLNSIKEEFYSLLSQ